MVVLGYEVSLMGVLAGKRVGSTHLRLVQQLDRYADSARHGFLVNTVTP